MPVVGQPFGRVYSCPGWPQSGVDQEPFTCTTHQHSAWQKRTSAAQGHCDSVITYRFIHIIISLSFHPYDSWSAIQHYSNRRHYVILFYCIYASIFQPLTYSESSRETRRQPSWLAPFGAQDKHWEIFNWTSFLFPAPFSPHSHHSKSSLRSSDCLRNSDFPLGCWS